MAKSPITISELNQRITFQTLTRTSDGQGGWTETWTTFATVWAKVKPKSARERYFSQQVQETITHEITIRKLANVTTEMRVLHGAVYYQLHGKFKIDSRNFFMTIDAEEGVGS